MSDKKDVVILSRSIDNITFEIKELCRQSKITVLVYAVEIGRRLVEAKAALPYGSWGEWLKNEVEFSQSSANNFMRLYEEYGSSKGSCVLSFEDSQSIANLPYTKALQLLSIPSEERESFVSENNVEEISVSELKRLLDERNEELRKREENEKNIISKAESDKERFDNEIAGLRRELDDARAKERSLSEKFEAARKNPKISSSVMKKIKAEAKEKAQEEVKTELESALKKAESAEADKKDAVKALDDAKAALEDAERRLKVSDPDVIAFKTLFTSMQHTVSELEQIIVRVKNNDPTTAEKLVMALETYISDVVAKELCTFQN